MMRKKPMLAYPVSNKPIDYSDKVSIQPKLDGVRCLIQWEFSQDTDVWDKSDFPGKVVAYSRTGKEWKNIDHILTELIPFFAKYPNAILDGELYTHDLKDDFEKIISLVRKTKPTDEDRLESKEMVQFHWYDTIMEHMDFASRDKFIQDNFIIKNTAWNIIVPTPSCVVYNTEEVEAKHDYFLEMGYEGSILRQNKPYECKRSWTLMKVKDFSDAEALIVGYEEGKGKREGTLGKFLIQDEDGNKFGFPPGKVYNYQDMRDMLKDIHKYMGQTATFTYFERTKAGSYRHPLFKAIRNYE